MRRIDVPMVVYSSLLHVSPFFQMLPTRTSTCKQSYLAPRGSLSEIGGAERGPAQGGQRVGPGFQGKGALLREE